MSRLRHLVVITLLTGFCLPLQAARVALVIGNGDYTDGRLKNPVNDARAMDAKLASLGFTVQRVENMKRNQIGRTLSSFTASIHPGDDVVVFYAGHGVQVKGINYLPAVDADIQSEEDVPLYSLNLNALMDRMDEAKAGLKLLFLDACRNNPYARSFRGGERGLAKISAAPTGTLIHFATRPGSVAADGSGANGLYTTQLLRHLATPNLPLEAMLKRVTADVEDVSHGQQEPWSEGRIRGDFYFKTSSAGPASPLANLGGAEQAAWNQASETDNIDAYGAYLNSFPQGRHADRAQQALQALQSQVAEREEQAMLKTLASWETQDYRRYLERFPSGFFASQAKAKLEVLVQQEQQRQASAAADRARRIESNRKARETECADARNPYSSWRGPDQHRQWELACQARYPLD